MENSLESVLKPVKRKLRWYQYSLRSLLIFVTLFAVACSWFAVKMGQAKRQREAVEILLKLGGLAEYDCACDSPYVQHHLPEGRPPISAPIWLQKWLGDDFFTNVVSLYPRHIADADLEYVTDLPRITAIGLPFNKITDNGLKQIQVLHQLQFLDLQSTEVTDAGLDVFTSFPALRCLYLSNTQITDAGLKRLQGLTEIEELDLGETEITDSGLENIKGLAHLKLLGLDHTKVTDAGLIHLRGLSQLQFLSLAGTTITDVGIANLQKALPNVEIKR